MRSFAEGGQSTIRPCRAIHALGNAFLSMSPRCRFWRTVTVVFRRHRPPPIKSGVNSSGRSSNRHRSRPSAASPPHRHRVTAGHDDGAKDRPASRLRLADEAAIETQQKQNEMHDGASGADRRRLDEPAARNAARPLRVGPRNSSSGRARVERSSEEYRRLARECLEMAQTVEEESARVVLLHMAQVWLRLAEARETDASRK